MRIKNLYSGISVAIILKFVVTHLYLLTINQNNIKMEKRDQKKLSLNKFTVSRLTGIHSIYGGNEGDPGEPTATVTKTLKTQNTIVFYAIKNPGVPL